MGERARGPHGADRTDRVACGTAAPSACVSCSVVAGRQRRVANARAWQFVRVFQSCHGGAAPGVVVLPGAVPERARVGTGADHRVVGAVRLPGRAGCLRRRRGRAHGGVLQRGAGLPVGVVPAQAYGWVWATPDAEEHDGPRVPVSRCTGEVLAAAAADDSS